MHALRFDTSRSGSRDQQQPISCDFSGFCILGGISYKPKHESLANRKSQKKISEKFVYIKKKSYLCTKISNY